MGVLTWWSLVVVLQGAVALSSSTEAAEPAQAQPTVTTSKPATPTTSLAPVREGQAQSSHAPYLAGECMFCHETMPARKPVKLKTSPPGMCLACHDQTADMDSHKDLVTTSCVECHNPHNSTNKSLLH